MLACVSTALIVPTLAAGPFRLRPFTLTDIDNMYARLPADPLPEDV
jgi:hypothetical protein